MPVPDLTDLIRRMSGRLDQKALAWVDECCAAISRDPAAIRTRFPAVGRAVGPGPLDVDADPDDLFAWTVQDAVRVRLLSACGDAMAAEAIELYRFGDPLERRAVLRALDVLPIGHAGIPVVEDAVRTNDNRLIAAALGPFGADALDDNAFRQAVLKCVFVGIPLSGVSGLDTRTDPDLSRVLALYACERVAAGRTVPEDIWPLVNRHPPTEELAVLEEERHSSYLDRRTAAEAALTARGRAGA